MGTNGPSGVTSYDEEAEECVHVSVCLYECVDRLLHGHSAHYCSKWGIKLSSKKLLKCFLLFGHIVGLCLSGGKRLVLKIL